MNDAIDRLTGEASLILTIVGLSAIVEEMKKPIEVEIDDEEFYGFLKQSMGISKDRPLVSMVEETKDRVGMLERALMLERIDRKCDDKLFLEETKAATAEVRLSIEEGFNRVGDRLADNQSNREQMELARKSLDELSKIVANSFESIDKQSAQPITINVPVTVEPTPIEIEVENKVEPAEVKIINEVKTPNVNIRNDVRPSEVTTPITVEPAPVHIENKIETPKVVVNSEPQINVVVPEIPAAKVEVKVDVTRDDAPKRATIIHPDQRQSQVILED